MSINTIIENFELKCVVADITMCHPIGRSKCKKTILASAEVNVADSKMYRPAGGSKCRDDPRTFRARRKILASAEASAADTRIYRLLSGRP